MVDQAPPEFNSEPIGILCHMVSFASCFTEIKSTVHSRNDIFVGHTKALNANLDNCKQSAFIGSNPKISSNFQVNPSENPDLLVMMILSRIASLGFCRMILVVTCLGMPACGIVKTTYKITKGTAKAGYKITKGTIKTSYKVTRFAGKTVYTIGKFTIPVVIAPLTWPLTHEDIESIDGLSPKDAIQQGRVKKSPYVVKGKRYVPMSVEEARSYRQKGIASWYGYETYRQKDGHMTANGEAFDPNGLNAAHKYLPLPTFVRVTNLDNKRQIILRVNDRGPFIDGRIIDLSAGAAKKLGFYEKGTARVVVETIDLDG